MPTTGVFPAAMKLPPLLLSAVLFLTPAGLSSVRASAAAASPESLGFSSERLQRLDAVIDDYTARQQIAGSVVYIARQGQIVQLKAHGQQNIAAGQPMRTDAIFRIASMSKAITAVAV